MATALAGCVIVEEKDNMIKYKKKCEKCGALDGGATLTAAPSPGSRKQNVFVCPKCKAKNQYIIKG